MKKLHIYKENDEFVIEKVNEFNHATKRSFISEEGLFEHLEVYKDVLDQYKLEVTDDLWSKVLNYLNTGEKPSHGGKREGAGRPSLGTTKKVSITLPDEVWERIEHEKSYRGDISMSQFIRETLIHYFFPSGLK